MTAQSEIPVRVTDKMLEREKYLRKLKNDEEEEESLVVFDDLPGSSSQRGLKESAADTLNSVGKTTFAQSTISRKKRKPINPFECERNQVLSTSFLILYLLLAVPDDMVAGDLNRIPEAKVQQLEVSSRTDTPESSRANSDSEGRPSIRPKKKKKTLPKQGQ